MIQCSMCGSLATQQHHLVTRRHKAIKNHPMNILPLCYHCHFTRLCAPHQNQKAFDAFLSVAYPARYKFMMENRWAKHGEVRK